MFEPSSTYRGPAGTLPHYFSFEAEGGHRYHVALQMLDPSPGASLRLDGQFGGYTEVVPAIAVAELIVESDFTGSYHLLVQQSYGEARPYRIDVRELPPDAEAQQHQDPDHEGLRLGSVFQGTLDHPTDVDCFRINPGAGQRYLVTVEGRGETPLTSGAVAEPYSVQSVFYPVFAGVASVWSTVIDVRSAGGSGDYMLKVVERPADDHVDVVGAAQSLDTLAPVAGTIEVPGDIDWFQVTDVAGRPAEIRLTPTNPDPWGNRVDFAGWSDGAYIGSTNAADGKTAVLTLPGTGAGVIDLRVSSASTSLGYSLQARVLPRDDHADTVAGATPLPLEQPVFGRLASLADQDTFALDLRADVVYRIDIDGVIPYSMRARLGAHQDLATNTWMPQQGWWVDAHHFVLQTVVPDAGLYSLTLAGAESEYRIRLGTVGPDDHSDSALGATSIDPTGVSGGLLDRFDVDSFVVQAVPGRQFHVRFDSTGVQGLGHGSVETSGPAGLTTSREFDPSGRSRSVDFSVSEAGPVVLQIVGDGRTVVPYAVRVESQAITVRDPGPAPDRNDPEVTVLTVGSVLDIRRVDGGNGDDHLPGTDGDDVLHGAGGRDRFEFGSGIDKIHGGDGDDVLTVDGLRSDFMVEGWYRGDLGWVLRRSDHSVTTVEHVERIEFEDSGLLVGPGVDSSAVLRLLQAIVGLDEALASETLGRALSQWDQGRDLEALARWALNDPRIGSRLDASSPDLLVLQVSEHVPGLLGSAAETAHWVDLLGRGVVSPEQALVAAVTLPPPDIYLVGITYPVFYIVSEQGG